MYYHSCTHHVYLLHSYKPVLQASCTAQAERLLARIESSKIKGVDYDLRDIVRLRALCQVGVEGTHTV